MTEPAAKRQRTESAESNSNTGGGSALTTALPAAATAVMDQFNAQQKEKEKRRLVDFQELADSGEDIYRIPEFAEGWVLRHGTSLQLMATCGTLLNLEFSETQPSDDYAKWYLFIIEGTHTYNIAVWLLEIRASRVCALHFNGTRRQLDLPLRVAAD